MLAFPSYAQTALANHDLPLEPARPRRSPRLHGPSPDRTGTLSADERRRPHHEADLESALCDLPDG
jgi:hypothetical protein